MMPDTAPHPGHTQEVQSQQAVPLQAPDPMQKPPELTATPTKCNACDMMVTLGLLTSSCEGIEDPTKRTACKGILKPLEEGKGKAVDVLADVIVELGEDHLDQTVERFNLLLYEATAIAKDKLIAKGVLNKDGTPKN
jgi:hypothetical protein